MHISEVKIKNFQSHEKTKLKLSKNLNVIFGNGDHGKSAILRSIKWVIENRPLGNTFRKHDTDETFVELKKDKKIIKRKKSNSKNEYSINKNLPLKALGSNVPEDVSSALNLSNINIQEQDKSFFLINESPGKRSKLLNEVAGLQEMDSCLKITSSEIRSINSNIENKKEQIENFEKELKKLKWVKSADVQLEKLQKQEREIKEKEEKHLYIINLINSISKFKNRKSMLLSDEFISSLQKIIKTRNSIEKLESHYEKIRKIIEKITNLKERAESIVIISVKNLEKEQNDVNSTQNRFDLIQDIIEEIEFKKTQHMQIKSEIEKTEKRIKKELKKMGVCPICKTKME